MQERRRAKRPPVTRSIFVGLAVATAGVLATTGLARAYEACPGSPVASASLRGMERELLERINGERSGHGLAPYAWSDRLATVARQHADRMSQAGRWFHNEAYLYNPKRVGATRVGENVAYGCSTNDIHRWWMDSGAHASRILDPGYTLAGVGLASDRNGVLYAVENFSQPPSRAAAVGPVTQQPAGPAAPSQPEPAAAQEPTPWSRLGTAAGGALRGAAAPRTDEVDHTSGVSPRPGAPAVTGFLALGGLALLALALTRTERTSVWEVRSEDSRSR